MFRHAQATKPKTPATRNAEIKTLPPPTGGINDRDALIGMVPTDALRIQNYICRPYGLQVRNGFSEFARVDTSGLPGGRVHSLIPFVPNADPVFTGQSDYNPFNLPFLHHSPVQQTPGTYAVPGAKLFAGANTQVYDVTAGGVGPFTAETGPVGTYWTHTHFTTLGGTFLCMTPLEGGYWYYDGTVWHTVIAGDGTTADTISGVDPAEFDFVLAWKGRLWFVEQDSTRGWYLPPGVLYGVAKAYDFGTVFRRGGTLQAMASWTQDAGAGIDDQLVVVGTEGDVSVYKGTDPDATDTFGLVGVWYVGPTPLGNRVLDPYGGDLHILSTAGLTMLSKLLRLGETEQDQVRSTDKINNTLAAFVKVAQGDPGWGIKYLPGDNLVALTMPYSPLQRSTMLVQDVNTKGWSVLYDHPCESMAIFNGETYAGSPDGRVVKALNAVLDDVLLDNPAGLLIDTLVVPAYSDLDKPGLEKIVKQIRVSLLGSRPPVITLAALVNYSLQQQTYRPALPRIDETRWDQALWGIDRWSGGLRPIVRWLGISGSGFTVTPQIQMSAYGGLILSQYDWLYETGGPL
jgi:hypothetical protein